MYNMLFYHEYGKFPTPEILPSLHLALILAGFTVIAILKFGLLPVNPDLDVDVRRATV